MQAKSAPSTVSRGSVIGTRFAPPIVHLAVRIASRRHSAVCRSLPGSALDCRCCCRQLQVGNADVDRCQVAGFGEKTAATADRAESVGHR